MSAASHLRLCNHRAVASAAVEDAVATGADETAEDDQDDPKDDLALEKLHDSDDHEDGSDDPEDGCVHAWTLLGVSGALVAVPRQVVDAGDPWLAAEGGVAAVMVVGVEPAVESSAPFGF